MYMDGRSKHMSEQRSIEIGKLPVEQRLGLSGGAAAVTPLGAPADDLKALALVLHKISAGVSNFLQAASTCEREPSRQQRMALAMFSGDLESSKQILDYIVEAEQRMAAVKSHLLASQS
jgi:hypothetical protein